MFFSSHVRRPEHQYVQKQTRRGQTQQPPPGAQYTIHIYHSSIKNQSILCSFDLTNFHIINKLWLNVCTGLFHWFNRIKFSYRSIITALPFIKYIIVAPQTLLSFDGNTFSTFATNHNTSDFQSSWIITPSPFILRSWSFTLQF